MYNKKNYSFDDLPDFVTILKKDLRLSKVALGLISLPPEKGYSFLHAHKEQEEVYIILSGNGVMQIEKEELLLKPGDIIRVAPEAKRALKAGSEKLVAICCGGVTKGFPKKEDSRTLIDDGIPYFDELPNWFEGNEKIMLYNQKLKEKSQLKK